MQSSVSVTRGVRALLLFYYSQWVMNQGNKSCGYLIAEFNSFNCSASTDVDLITVFDKWPNLVFY